MDVEYTPTGKTVIILTEDELTTLGKIVYHGLRYFSTAGGDIDLITEEDIVTLDALARGVIMRPI